MSKELIIPNDLTPEIFTNDGIEPLLKEVAEKVANFNGDVSTDTGRKEMASFAYKITRSKTAVDDMGKEYVAELKELPKKIDAQRKIFREGMDALKDQVRKPLTDWEEVNKQRVADHEDKITMIIENGNDCLSDWQIMEPSQMQLRLNNIRGLTDRLWEEFSSRASQVIPEAIEKIETAIAKREAYEKEQVELEQLRKEKVEREKREYEEKLKAEAAEKARIEAEQKAKLEAERVQNEIRLAEESRKRAEAELAVTKQKVIDDAKRAEEAKIEAEKKAKADAEAAVIREQERVAAEKKAKAEAQAKLEANKKHKAKIHQEIKGALLAGGMTEYESNLAIDLIDSGKIPHVQIRY